MAVTKIVAWPPYSISRGVGWTTSTKSWKGFYSRVKSLFKLLGELTWTSPHISWSIVIIWWCLKASWQENSKFEHLPHLHCVLCLANFILLMNPNQAPRLLLCLLQLSLFLLSDIEILLLSFIDFPKSLNNRDSRLGWLILKEHRLFFRVWKPYHLWHKSWEFPHHVIFEDFQRYFPKIRLPGLPLYLRCSIFDWLYKSCFILLPLLWWWWSSWRWTASRGCSCWRL